MTHYMLTEVVQKVLHSAAAGNGTTHNTAQPSKNVASTYACLPVTATFCSLFIDGFVFATFMCPLSSNIDAGADDSSCII